MKISENFLKDLKNRIYPPKRSKMQRIIFFLILKICLYNLSLACDLEIIRKFFRETRNKQTQRLFILVKIWLDNAFLERFLRNL